MSIGKSHLQSRLFELAASSHSQGKWREIHAPFSHLTGAKTSDQLSSVGLMGWLSRIKVLATKTYVASSILRTLKVEGKN